MVAALEPVAAGPAVASGLPGTPQKHRAFARKAAKLDRQRAGQQQAGHGDQDGRRPQHSDRYPPTAAHFPMQNRAKMASSSSSLAVSPVSSPSASRARPTSPETTSSVLARAAPSA